VDGETYVIERVTSTEGVNDDISVLSQQTIDGRYLLTLIQMGDHDYIIFAGIEKGSMLHYEDCRYCKSHKSN
jgi:hypothetical protein